MYHADRKLLKTKGKSGGEVPAFYGGMGTLPPLGSPEPILIDGPGVHLDPEALHQLGRVARLPGCSRVVGMPDLHPGRGIPIGVASAFRDRLHPELVGSDAGCGVTVAVARRVVAPNKRQRRVERSGRPAMAAEPLALLDAAWHGGPRGLAAVAGLGPEFSAWVDDLSWEDMGPLAPLPEVLRSPTFGEALGPIGGGNHFLELGRVDEVLEPDALDGLKPGAHVVLAHSGSRSLGHAVAERWKGQDVDTDVTMRRYLGELAGCVRFAQANRAVLVWQMLEAVGSGRADRIGGTVDLVHNTVAAGSEGWVHRKGAAPAERGALTVTLGSRGTPSWLLRGSGAQEHLCSVAHGAGRRIARSEAKARLSRRYRRDALRRTDSGGHVLCDDPDLLWEEHPDAYKPIEPVVAALEAAGVARRVASLRPEITVKR